MTFEEWVAAIRAKAAALNQLADEIDALAFDIPPVTPPEPEVEVVTGVGGAVGGGTAEAVYVPAPEPEPEFAITAGPDVLNLTDTGVVIEWHLSEPGTGITRYGLNPSALSLSRVESRLLPMHRQTFTGVLQPNTTYYYRVESKNAAGKTITTPIASFKTWPTLTDTALAEAFKGQADAPPTIRPSAATFVGSLGKIAVAAIDEGRINFE